MNFMHIFEQGNPVLIAVFALLISMSIISWYLIFWKSWNASKERAELAAFRKHYMQTPDWPIRGIAANANAKGSAVRLLIETQKLAPTLAAYSPEERRQILSMSLPQALDSIRIELDKGLTILASIGTSAPFIGLFGTVWGIYGSLMHISAEGNASLNVVAGPMGEALIATAVGLFAAIPAVLAYNAFVRVNRVMVQDLRHIAEQLSTYLSFAAAEPVKIAKVVR